MRISDWSSDVCSSDLASLVGQRRGARITASDCHPLAETFLDENARLNQLPLLKYRYGQWGVDVIVDDQDLPDDVLRGRYDLIIGSDLLYERDAPQSLAQFIDRHAVDDAEVWMVDPNRGHRPAFNRHMASHGFVLQRSLRLPGPPIAGKVSDAAPSPHKGRTLVYMRGGLLAS